VLDTTNDLVNAGYLKATAILNVSFVGGISQYQVRFVPTLAERNASYSPPLRGSGATQPTTWNKPIGVSVVWIPEVMVTIPQTTMIATLQKTTGAIDCVQANWSTSATCLTTGKTPAVGIRFSHQPSFVSHSGSGSSYWLMTPSLTALRDQERSSSPTVVISTGNANNQFSTCGN
jgi:hypothetical protein